MLTGVFYGVDCAWQAVRRPGRRCYICSTETLRELPRLKTTKKGMQAVGSKFLEGETMRDEF